MHTERASAPLAPAGRAATGPVGARRSPQAADIVLDAPVETPPPASWIDPRTQPAGHPGT